MTVIILILVAVILVCTLFIINALNQVADTNDHMKYLEQIIATIDTNVKNKSDGQWYIEIDKKIQKLRRAAMYSGEGNVDLELKTMIRELTIWMLSRKS